MARCTAGAVSVLAWSVLGGIAMTGGQVRALPQPGSPAATLPRPTGPFTIGTTSFRVLDDTRTDPFARPGEPRQVEVLAWYPAVNGATGERAPYLRAGREEGSAFATLLRQPAGAFDYLSTVRTSAVLDAPPRGGRPLPVLVFSHGYTGIASSYTALLEDLASHGYAVMSIVHPYEAMAARLRDGRVVTVLDDKQQMRQGIRDVLAEWSREDETMAAVTAAPDDRARERLMRAYLATLPRTTAALRRWVDDTSLVLDRLARLPAGPAARLAGRLDLTSLGAFGHSMGGVTAAQFCAEERRCRAALNLDGIPQYGPLIDTPMNRPLLMAYSGRTGRLGASDVIYRRAARPYIRVDVAGTLHNDFGDLGLWGGPLAGRPLFGTLPPEQAVGVTRRLVREFFDQVLRGQRSPLLSGSTAVPGVTVR